MKRHKRYLCFFHELLSDSSIVLIIKPPGECRLVSTKGWLSHFIRYLIFCSLADFSSDEVQWTCLLALSCTALESVSSTILCSSIIDLTIHNCSNCLLY